MSRSTDQDKIYTEFVDRIISENQKRQLKKLPKTISSNQNRNGMIIEPVFNSERVKQHIESEKRRPTE